MSTSHLNRVTPLTPAPHQAYVLALAAAVGPKSFLVRSNSVRPSGNKRDIVRARAMLRDAQHPRSSRNILEEASAPAPAPKSTPVPPGKETGSGSLPSSANGEVDDGETKGDEGPTHPAPTPPVINETYLKHAGEVELRLSVFPLLVHHWCLAQDDKRALKIAKGVGQATLLRCVTQSTWCRRLTQPHRWTCTCAWWTWSRSYALREIQDAFPHLDSSRRARRRISGTSGTAAPTASGTSTTSDTTARPDSARSRPRPRMRRGSSTREVVVGGNSELGDDENMREAYVRRCSGV